MCPGNSGTWYMAFPSIFLDFYLLILFQLIPQNLRLWDVFTFILEDI